MRISDWSSDVCSSDLLDDMRLALVPGVAAAQRDAELIGQIIGEIAVERRSLGAHVARGIAVEPRQPDQLAGQPQKHVERGLRGGTQIIITENAVEQIAVVEDLKFMAGLLVAYDGGNQARKRVGSGKRG